MSKLESDLARGRNPHGPLTGVRQPYLIVLSGAQIGHMHRIKLGTSTLGRAPSVDLFLDEEGIERLHTEIINLPDGTVLIRDCGSPGGTMVNGAPVGQTPRRLVDGDRVQLGGVAILKFSYQEQLEDVFQRQLYRTATEDPLTGIHNKRFLDERLQQEWTHAQRYGDPLSVAIFDVDHLSNVNDTWGHAAGDQVLQTVARRLAKATRAGEVLARIGGEELALVMRKTAMPYALLGAERMRRLVCDAPVTWDREEIGVTVSVGVAASDLDTVDSGAALLARADEYLYRAKREGRDRVCGPRAA